MSIETDWFWATVTNGFIEPWRPSAHSQNRSLLRAAASAAAVLATAGYDVVLEGVIGPWMLPLVTEPLHDGAIEIAYIMLRPATDTCLARAAARRDDEPRVEGHPPLTDSGPIRHLAAQMVDLGPYEAHAVDTTDLDPTATAEQFLARLALGAFRLA